MRARLVVASVAVAAALAACGGSSEPPATLSSVEQPLTAQPTGQALAAEPIGQALAAVPTDPSTSSDADRLNEAESSTAESASEPPICELVSAAQARAIMGVPVSRPVVAPQGPTCVYRARTRKGEDPRDGFITVTVQHRALADARKQLTRARRIQVGGQVGFCGEGGQPMLFLEVPGGRVLGIVGACGTAKRFAERALGRLSA